MDILIVGGGAALAESLIDHYLSSPDNRVAVVCRKTLPAQRYLSRVLVYRHVEDVPNYLDLLITLPGHVDNAPLIEMTDGQWNSVVNATLTVPFQALRRLLPVMRPNSNVVVVGSIAGKLGGRGCANYAAAKAGLVGLVSAAANENLDRGICINLLELGYIYAGMGAGLSEALRHKIMHTIPLRRFGDVQDFVLAIEFLSRTRYMSGGILTLAGGLR